MTNIKVVKLSEIEPDLLNANRHTERGNKMLRQSIQQFGFAEAGTLDKHNRIIGGNHRTEVSADVLATDEAIVIEIDGSQPVYIKRNDLDLSSEEGRQLSYFLNRSAQVSIDFDPERILADIEMGINFDDLFQDWEIEKITAEIEGEVVNDPYGEWEGMPEFEQEDRTSFRSIHIHFKDQKAINTFAKLIGQEIGDKIRSLWFPKAETINMKDIYTNES